MYVIVRRQETPQLGGSGNAPSVIHEEFAMAAGEASRLATNHIGSFFDVFELVHVGTALGQIAVTWSEIKPERARRKK